MRLSLISIVILILINYPTMTSVYTQCNGIEDSDIILITYTGTFENGTQFDAQESVDFTVSSDFLIEGFYQNLLGMVIEERKQFEVPPYQGYQDPDDLYFGFTLNFDVFIIDILSKIDDCGFFQIQGQDPVIVFTRYSLIFIVTSFIGYLIFTKVNRTRAKMCYHCKEEGMSIQATGKCSKCNSPSCDRSFFNRKVVGCWECGANQFIRF